MKHGLPLALSLTLNVILIGAFFFAPERQSVPRDLSAPKPLTSLRQPRMISEPGQIPKPAKASPSRGSTGLAWQQSLHQLRDAGVPNDVLAGLVISDFEIRWQRELRELEQRYQAGVVDEDERARFEARRDEEQERALRAALGEEGFRQWDKAYTLRDLDLVQLQLSSSQTDALYQLRKDRALADRMLAEALRNAEIDPAAHNERQSAAQEEYDQQFKRVLGDQRYEALQNFEAGGARASAENQDPRYQLLKRYAHIWSLSQNDIDYIYSSVQQYRKSGPSSRDQIEQSLISYLGPERFDRLRKNDLFDPGEQ